MEALIFNVGSSSLKWTALRQDESVIAQGNEDSGGIEPASLRATVGRIAARVPDAGLIGHRVVHGGALFQSAVRIDAAVRAQLEQLAALDPLHMRPALAVIDAAQAAIPHVPQVASFDTAFHRTICPAAAGYALPREWDRLFPGGAGARRYGFHGLSVQWSIERASVALGALPPRVLVAHLGSGCSVTAVREGCSIDTTMGFTPLDGLMMSTRSGAVDPGLLLRLQREGGLALAALEDGLENHSGLLGVSGISGDLRAVLTAADQGDARAQLAYDRFVVYGRRGLGAMAGSLGGIDALIFTGGIGEHSPRVRADLARFLGEDLIDPQRNKLQFLSESSSASRDAFEIGAGSPRVLVVRAREDLIVARQARQLMGAWTTSRTPSSD